MWGYASGANVKIMWRYASGANVKIMWGYVSGAKFYGVKFKFVKNVDFGVK